MLGYICLLAVRLPSGPGPLQYACYTTTLGKTPLFECSARRTNLYLTTHNTRNRQTSMPLLNSNPQSQLAGVRRPTLQTARQLGTSS